MSKAYQWWDLSATIGSLWELRQEQTVSYDDHALEWDVKELGKMISDNLYVPTLYNIYPPHQKMETNEFFREYGIEEVDEIKEKKIFLVFTRVLLKYLEEEGLNHREVRSVIRDCAERNKRGEPGYGSVVFSMKRRLKKVVSEEHWKEAEVCLVRFLKERDG